ncbi:GNAT family N-acetyltransferase [Phaeobacter sp. HF9A]|uniref:GNAT family N-acetyltransferase n=1 Tax=Phaeobacter sp. HF9A TaxID=2721561 RepID=UPI00143108EF|nr:GNAT family N-acetyltransferase [Phaeobacter sp. HF9A]NIZ15271.1 GNAT family N-acetyltransferase [Phaeobacter sp. HF9A]
MKLSLLDPAEAACLLPLFQDLHALHVAHHPERYPAEPDPEAMAEWMQAWLAEPQSHALVARSPQEVVMGYLVYEIEERRALPVRPAETRATVQHIAVAEPFRRMGVGRALMSEMKRRALDQGVSVIATTYAPFNAASAGLMRSHGLEPVLTMAEWRRTPQPAA